MNETGILGAFASHAFLSELTDYQRMALASGVRPFRVAPGEYLSREGMAAKSFYLIQSGSVAIEIKQPGRGAVRVQEVGPGEIVGWSWIVPPHRWKFDARAVDTVSGLAFDAEWLRARCEQDHDLGYLVLKQLVAVISSRLAAARVQLSKLDSE